MYKYLILEDDGFYMIMEAEDFTDLMKKYYNYYGGKSEYYQEALTGIRHTGDMVDFTNSMLQHDYDIKAIYIIGQEIYKK